MCAKDRTAEVKTCMAIVISSKKYIYVHICIYNMNDITIMDDITLIIRNKA